MNANPSTQLSLIKLQHMNGTSMSYTLLIIAMALIAHKVSANLAMDIVIGAFKSLL